MAGTDTLTPYLAVHDATAAIAFYVEVFGAAEIDRWVGEDGRVGHAELRFGGARLFLSDEHPELNVFGPQTRGGPTASFVLELADVDAVWDAALAAGARVDRPLSEQPHGRAGWLYDPFGHRWNLFTAVRS